jgi:hypothetical protein
MVTHDHQTIPRNPRTGDGKAITAKRAVGGAAHLQKEADTHHHPAR